MEHAPHLARPFPWRTAALVAGAIAALELVALIGVGAIRLVPSTHTSPVASTPEKPQPVAARPAVHLPRSRAVPPQPLRPRSQVRVLVLNANGVQGAAAAEAARLQGAGYRIAGAQNAPPHHYARSMVLYLPGWVKNARRLARDTGIALVAPVDGLGPGRLRGSKLVVLLGS